MGKASKWIINFLLGKKEYRKRSDTSLSMEFISTKTESQSGTPKVKRRWSFRRLAGKNGSRKFSNSFDSIEAKLPLQSHVDALAAIRGHIENVAATKIQAAFRSFLARKALLALRGLVKLQALVRGYIVRKQTVSELKQMHALMSIQVRARVQRIQMAEETQLVVRRQSSMDDSLTHDHRPLVSKSSSDHLSRARMERINIALSDHLSVSKRFEFEDYSTTAQNSPQSYSVPPLDCFAHCRQRNYPEPLSRGYQLLPNYTVNTESSRAKFRSHSEPKQRPKWNTKQKNKQTMITDGIRISLDEPVIKRSSSHCKFDTCDDHDPWFCKLYETERSSSNNNNKCETLRSPVSHSKYYESFADYEPNFNLY